MFVAGIVGNTIATPPPITMDVIRLSGWDQELHRALVRLPDDATGQSRWAGNNQIASSGALVQRHAAFYLQLVSELDAVPRDQAGHMLVNRLLGKAEEWARNLDGHLLTLKLPCYSRER